MQLRFSFLVICRIVCVFVLWQNDWWRQNFLSRVFVPLFHFYFFLALLFKTEKKKFQNFASLSSVFIEFAYIILMKAKHEWGCYKCRWIPHPNNNKGTWTMRHSWSWQGTETNKQTNERKNDDTVKDTAKWCVGVGDWRAKEPNRKIRCQRGK